MRRLFLLWSMLLALSGVAAMQAQTPAPPAPPSASLDLVFVIDQSGSMGGAAFGSTERQEGNDPNNWRFLAVQEALRTLGEYRLFRTPEVALRVAVVYFGDTAELALDWTELATTSPEEWELDLQLLQQQLSAESYPRNLGSTNFRDALTFAAQVFDEAPPAPAPQTLRGVVILTDGDPCVPTEFDCVRDDAAKLNHMRDVQQLAAGQFPSPDYILYVLALDEGGRYWPQFEAAWVQVVGDASRATLIESDVAIAGRFRQILDELIAQVAPEASANQGEQLAPGTNTIIVDPYLRSIQFTLYKPTNTPSNLSVIDAEGRALDANSAQVSISGSSDFVERWTISSPYPGRWNVIVPEAETQMDVFLDKFTLEPTVLTSQPPFLRFDRPFIELRLFDETGRPLPEYPAPYTLTIAAGVTAPDGTSAELPLTLREVGVYRADLFLSQAGRYALSLRATTQDLNGTPLILYDNPALATFEAADVSFELTGVPVETAQVGTDASLSLVVRDAAGDTLDLNWGGTAQLLTLTETPVGEPVVLARDLSGLLLGTLPLDEAGEFLLRVEAQLAQDDGTLTTIFSQTSAPFSVLGTDFIGVRVVSPASTDEQYTRQGFPPTRDASTTIVVQTYLVENNALIDLNSLLPEGLARLSVQLTDETGTAQALTLTPSDTAGEYTVTVGDLPVGTYQFSVAGEGILVDTYLFDENAARAEATLIRTANPLVLILRVAAGVVGVLLVLGLVLAGLSYRRASARRLRGKIVVYRSDGGSGYGDDRIPIINLNLDGRRPRTKIILKPEQFRGAKKKAKVTLECDSENMSRQKQARVTIVVDGVQLSRTVIMPNMEITLFSEYDDISGDDRVFLLAKDYDPGTY